MANLRVILRGLGRNPVFTLIAILSLALGIGANTAIFSMLDQVLLRTLPVKNPHELAFLYHPGPTQGSTSTDESGSPSFSYPAFKEMQKEQTPFTALAGARGTGVSLSYKNAASSGQAHQVSGNYFDVLGVRPAMGRLLTEDDDRTPGGGPVVVLGYSYWTSKFNNDPSVLNQQIIVNGFPMTIVGVAQKGFLSEKLGTTPDIFVPLTMRKEMDPGWNAFTNRQNYWLPVFGRMKPGMTLKRAETEINVTYAGQLQQDIALLKQPKPDLLERFKAKRVILKEGQYGRGGLRNEAQSPIYILMGITVLVLLIACANVANLQLARAAARTREVAVRLAMGASRGRLIGQLLLESCIVAIAGGLFGLITAYWTLRFITTAFPDKANMGFLTSTIDMRVLLFCLACSVATRSVVRTLSGAASYQAGSDIRHSKRNPVRLRRADRISSASRWSRHRFAISLLLLVAAGLLGRTLINLNRVDLGIRSDHLLTWLLMPRLNQYSDERARTFFEQVNERLKAIPGATMITLQPGFRDCGQQLQPNITVEGFTPQSDGDDNSNFNLVGPDYFRTMGVALVAGREITEADGPNAPKVAVVNEAFVRKFLPNQNPIGRRMARGGGKDVKLEIEIVGVVKDFKYSSLKEAPKTVFYLPHRQVKSQSALYYYVRTGIEPTQVIGQVRRIVSELDPNLPIRDLKTMETQIEENLFAERLLSQLTVSFCGPRDGARRGRAVRRAGVQALPGERARSGFAWRSARRRDMCAGWWVARWRSCSGSEQWLDWARLRVLVHC
jgi:predicted permease